MTDRYERRDPDPRDDVDEELLETNPDEQPGIPDDPQGPAEGGD